MLEVYQAYGDYRTMMDLTEKCIVDAIDVLGGESKRAYGEATIDFTPRSPQDVRRAVRRTDRPRSARREGDRWICGQA